MVNPLSKQVQQQLPGYYTPAEIAEVVSQVSGHPVSVHTILHGISGRRDSLILFAYKSQGRYWIPTDIAHQFIATGFGYPDPVPELGERELPGYYTPGEIAKQLNVTSLTVLHAVRGRPDRKKPPFLDAYLAQNRYWIPEQKAEQFIRSRQRDVVVPFQQRPPRIP